MRTKASSDTIETTMLLNDIADFRSSRTKPNYVLNNPEHNNAEILRASLLNAFKTVHEINLGSQKKDFGTINKVRTLFNKSSQSSTTRNSAIMQEAFAYMHRELTNLLTATGKDNERIDDKTFNKKVNEIVSKGFEKIPKGELQAPLEKQMELIRVKAEKCNAPVHKQESRRP